MKNLTFCGSSHLQIYVHGFTLGSDHVAKALFWNFFVFAYRVFFFRFWRFHWPFSAAAPYYVCIEDGGVACLFLHPLFNSGYQRGCSKKVFFAFFTFFVLHFGGFCS
ncbi:hypothetical protein AAHE18_01G034500 [Arachis hypogaea]